MNKLLKNNQNVGGGAALSTLTNKSVGFTLAEMMVVMLIMSIIMAAMAPVMTRKAKTDTSSPWKWSNLGSPHAYFGVNDSQTALIGQSIPAAADLASKLIINSASDNIRHILFKRGNAISGILNINKNGGLILGNTGIDNAGTNAIAIGTASKGAGDNSVAIGNGATTSYSSSIAIGRVAKTTSSYSIAIGDSAEASIYSAAYGYGAKATSSYSIAIGRNAQATSAEAVAFGHDAVAKNVNSTALGKLTSVESDGGIAVGSSAQVAADSKSAIAIGASSYVKGGGGPIVLGQSACAVGDYSISLGSDVCNRWSGGGEVGSENYKTYNYAIGIRGGVYAQGGISLGNWAFTRGKYSIAIGNTTEGKEGEDPGYLNTTDGKLDPIQTIAYNDHGIAIGYNTKTSGVDSIAIGTNARTSGRTSITIGGVATDDADDANGSHNVDIGYRRVGTSNVQGNYNVAIGADVLNAVTTGGNNIALGNQTAYSSTTGHNNIAIGQSSLFSNQTGSNNIAIGQNACQYVTGSKKVCIGTNSGPGVGTSQASSNDKIIYLGDSNTTVYIPGNLVVGRHVMLNTDAAEDSGGTGYQTLMHIRNKSHLSVIMSEGADYVKSSLSLDGETGDPLYQFSKQFFGKVLVSDRRLKYVGVENKDGLAKLRQLKVFNYTFKKDEKKTPHVGVIAQDLQKVFPKAVKKGEDGFLSIRMEDMFYAVINAIKELDAKVTTLINSVQQLQKETKQLRAENQELKKRLEALERAK